MIKKNIKFNSVRVRIAPSPTGFLHIGTARTALFNYLFAKKYGGSFILRIEDTDIGRSKPEFEKNIIEGLRWLGLDWSEGVESAGEYGPYRQSERLEIYEKYLKQLLSENKAYYCFCTEEELDVKRKELEGMGVVPKYSGKCANLSNDEIKKLQKEGKSSIIRFRMPKKSSNFIDLIHENIPFNADLIGDIVIAKDLKTPLYNFAVVIDDFEMKISNVIRGEDHISNTPKQLMLQESLGFSHPKYAHLPLTLGPDKTKLSKRHGATAISDYREWGYLPEALINFMAFLGWNPGGNKEIFSLEELTKEFTIEKINKSPAIFNIEKLNWYNGYYIRNKKLDELTMLCLPYLIEKKLIVPQNPKSQMPTVHTQPNPKKIKNPKFKIIETGEIVDFELLKKVVVLEQERMKKLSEIGESVAFFFKDKLDYDKELLHWKKMSDNEIREVLEKLEKILTEISVENWTKEKLQEIIMPEAEKTGDRGMMLWPMRVALTGKKASPGPFEIAEVLGKEKVLNRIKTAKEMFEI